MKNATEKAAAAAAAAANRAATENAAAAAAIKDLAQATTWSRLVAYVSLAKKIFLMNEGLYSSNMGSTWDRISSQMALS